MSEIAQCWATEAGKEQFGRVAEVLHFFGDQQSHVGAHDTAQHLETGERQVTLQVGPSEHWVQQALFTAAWCYGQMFDLAAEHFRMTHLDRWRAHWQILIARCGELPPQKMNDVLPTDLCPCGSGFTFEECHLGARCAQDHG